VHEARRTVGDEQGGRAGVEARGPGGGGAHAERRPAPAGVRVRSQYRDPALTQQGQPRRLGLGAVAAGQRPLVDLQQAAPPDLSSQRFAVAVEDARTALGVGDDHAEAPRPQLAGGGRELVAEAVERRFDQQPAAARRARRDRLELELTQPAHELVAELARAVNLDLEAGARQGAAKLLHQLGQDRDVGHEVRPHVRGGEDGAGPVGRGDGGHLNAVVEVSRAVVDSG